MKEVKPMLIASILKVGEWYLCFIVGAIFSISGSDGEILELTKAILHVQVFSNQNPWNLQFSGKTAIANFISESINIEEAGTPRPTQGARIVEFELTNLNVNGKLNNVDVELWDCSGDHKFESCWPALRVGVQGVILVCSPNTSSVASRELELLYNYFVSQPKLTAKQCVVFYNCTEEQDDVNSLNLSPTFSKVSQVGVNLKTGGSRLKIDFSNFVSSVLQAINKDVQ